jgi:hypothetical protein
VIVASPHDMRRHRSRWLSPPITTRDDIDRDRCRFSSQHETTSIAMVVASPHNMRRHRSRWLSPPITAQDDNACDGCRLEAQHRATTTAMIVVCEHEPKRQGLAPSGRTSRLSARRVSSGEPKGVGANATTVVEHVAWAEDCRRPCPETPLTGPRQRPAYQPKRTPPVLPTPLDAPSEHVGLWVEPEYDLVCRPRASPVTC